MLVTNERKLPEQAAIATSHVPGFHMETAVARDLAMRVLEGVKALPRRGLEIGGFLIGEVSGAQIRIDSLHPLYSEYPEGPAFKVSEPDFRNGVESAEAKGQIVGIYRSRTDGALELDDQSRFMLQALLTGSGIAFLVVRQTRQTPAEARAGLWIGRELKWLGEPLPFSDWTREAPLVSSISLPLVSTEAAKPSRRRTPLFAFGLVAAACCVALFWVSRPPAVQSALPPARALVIDGKAETPRARTVEIPKPEAPATVTAAREQVSSRNRTIARAFRLPEAKAPRRTIADVPRLAPAPAIAAPPDLSKAKPFSGPSLLPDAGNVRPLQFTPPVLVRQPRSVVLPPDLRRVLRHETVLSLKVTVDEKGHVLAIAAMNQLGKVEQSLLRAYSPAVSSWEFEPAVQNGRRVRADTILRFRVLPTP